MFMLTDLHSVGVSRQCVTCLLLLGMLGLGISSVFLLAHLSVKKFNIY